MSTSTYMCLSGLYELKIIIFRFIFNTVKKNAFSQHKNLEECFLSIYTYIRINVCMYICIFFVWTQDTYSNACLTQKERIFFFFFEISKSAILVLHVAKVFSTYYFFVLYWNRTAWITTYMILCAALSYLYETNFFLTKRLPTLLSLGR